MHRLRGLLMRRLTARLRRLPRKLLGFLAGAGMVLVLVLLGSRAVEQAAADPPPAPVPVQAPPSPMDRAVGLIAEARQSYQGVRDYTCTFIKREVVGTELKPENVMLMKVRSQPFSVYLRWLAPKSLAGQEVCYVAGRNNGMMRAHPVGILGIAGFVSVEPRDARAMKENRHPVTEAGIGNLIERTARHLEADRQSNKAQIQIGDFEYNKRPCTRAEAIHAERDGTGYAYRSVIYFDKITHLPIRFEAYDWPKPGGNPAGDLLECYSYVNVRPNVGLGEDAFNY